MFGAWLGVAEQIERRPAFGALVYRVLACKTLWRLRPLQSAGIDRVQPILDGASVIDW